MCYPQRWLVVFLLVASALATSCSKKQETMKNIRLQPGYDTPASAKPSAAGKKPGPSERIGPQSRPGSIAGYAGNGKDKTATAVKKPMSSEPRGPEPPP